MRLRRAARAERGQCRRYGRWNSICGRRKRADFLDLSRFVRGIAFFAGSLIFLQVLESSLLEGCGSGFHSTSDGGGSFFCIGGGGRSDSEEVAIADNGYAWHLSFRRACIRGNKCRSKRGRPHDFAMEHVREFVIGRVAMLAGHKITPSNFGNGLASDFPLRRG